MIYNKSGNQRERRRARCRAGTACRRQRERERDTKPKAQPIVPYHIRGRVVASGNDKTHTQTVRSFAVKELTASANGAQDSQ